MTFRLPDLNATWPFEHQINPDVDAGSASSDWFRSLRLFPSERQRKFDAINISSLPRMTYPHLGRAHLQLTADLLNLIFAVDEFSDDMNPEEAQDFVNAIFDAIQDPKKQRPANEHPLGEVHRQFWSTASSISSATATRRFMKSYGVYINAILQEAKNRKAHATNYTIDEYMDLRRYNGAIQPLFDMIFLPLEIPDAILDDRRVAELERIAADMIMLANDVVSYNKEQACDDVHNIIVVVMRVNGFDLQAAMDYVHAWYNQLGKDFIKGMDDLPHCKDAEVETQLKAYIQGLADWITGSWEWNFQSPRYFGSKGAEVRKTGIVELLPKVSK